MAILAVEPVSGETEKTNRQLFNKLKKRGLEDVWLVVSDAHKGLQVAIKKSFLGAAMTSSLYK